MRSFVPALIALAVAGGSVQAETAKEAAMGYELLNIKRGACLSRLQLDTTKAELGDGTVTDAYRGFVQCQMNVRRSADETYKKVSSKVRANAARGALKDYHAAFLTALESSEVRTGEDRGAYRQRLVSQDERLQLLWERLRLEL